MANKQLQWLAKRIPTNESVSLNPGNIFIFPTKFGFVFLSFMLLLFLMGTNYQNNLILMLSYLMASIFVLTIFQSFRNMLGIKLQAMGNAIGYVEQNIPLQLSISSTRESYAMRLFIPSHHSVFVPELKSNQSQSLALPFYVNKRGRHKPERIVIESLFAFGLIRTWSKIDLGIDVVAIPKPLSFTGQIPILQNNEDESESTLNSSSGAEEYYQLKSYVKGEPLSHVSWKHHARGQGMQTKEYRGYEGNQVWLDIQRVPFPHLEQRLSALVFCIQSFEQQGQTFGLRLHDIAISPNSGTQHIEQCLVEVACYGQ